MHVKIKILKLGKQASLHQNFIQNNKFVCQIISCRFDSMKMKVKNVSLCPIYPSKFSLATFLRLKSNWREVFSGICNTWFQINDLFEKIPSKMPMLHTSSKGRKARTYRVCKKKHSGLIQNSFLRSNVIKMKQQLLVWEKANLDFDMLQFYFTYKFMEILLFKISSVSLNVPKIRRVWVIMNQASLY